MTFMLPSSQIGTPSLADVLPSCLASLGVSGFPNVLDLRPVQSVVVVVVDGLGSQNLSAAKAHARFLSAGLSSATTITTVFPTTTASALASFTSGTLPGQNGMLGYRIRDPESKALVNQLTGLSDIVDIGSWLRARPLYGQARSANIHPVVVGHPRFEGSPLTALIHEGADYVGARSLADRAEATFSAVKASRSLVVFYISELDEIAHAKGVESHAWASKLEEVDACLEGLAKGLPKDTALLVTADHGVIDIPAHRHVEFGSDLTIFEGVDNIGGEPRCLQLYVRPEFDSHDIAATWQQHLGDTAIVAVREDVVESGWLGTVDAALVRRMGDVFVFAKKEVVFFDARDPTNKARMMVGHHGGISPVELRIPLLRLR